MEEKMWFLTDDRLLLSDDLPGLELETQSELALVALLALWGGSTRHRLARFFKPSSLERTIKSLSDRGIIIGR